MTSFLQIEELKCQILILDPTYKMDRDPGTNYVRHVIADASYKIVEEPIPGVTPDYLRIACLMTIRKFLMSPPPKVGCDA